MDQSRKITKALAEFKKQVGTFNMATVARYIAKELTKTPDHIALAVTMMDSNTFVLVPQNLFTAVCLYHDVPYRDVEGHIIFHVAESSTQGAGRFEFRDGRWMFVRDKDSAVLPCILTVKI